MTKNAHPHALESIERIHRLTKESKLSAAFFQEAAPQISHLSEYLNLQSEESVLFASAFVSWFDEANFADIFRHFGLSKFDVLKYRAAIEQLYSRNLLVNKGHHNRQITSYDVSQTVINLISQNQPVPFVPPAENTEAKNVVDILEQFDQASDRCDLGIISPPEFRVFIENLCRDHLDLPFFRELKNYRLDAFETYFFLDTVWDAISAGDNNFNTHIQRTVHDYFSRKSRSLAALQKIINRETRLSKLGLIEISNENFSNKHHAALSKKVIDFLREEEGIFIDQSFQNISRLIKCSALPARKLFYNDTEIAQLRQFADALKENKFNEMRRRLSEKNMPLAITVMLHGVPGTGKTETVYQLARQTGRNIFKADLSEIKSKWFGESEKLVKKIFTDYAEMRRTESRCPILLFNEADGIISKRKCTSVSSVAETENTLQNILLEKLENFDGILFATTNLLENLDGAFERRFLFKVCFTEPTAENAARIWREKMPSLRPREAARLATLFQFSGGEIENIARKCALNEVLTGQIADLPHIISLCENEKWTPKSSRNIGF